jgi:hypothetical protein
LNGYHFADTEAREQISQLSEEFNDFKENGGAGVAVDATLTQEGQAADAKAVGEKVKALTEEKVDKVLFDEIAENGFYVQEDAGEPVYISLSSGAATSTGVIESNSKRGYTILSKQQTQSALHFDTEVYNYSLVYFHGVERISYTGWLTDSPITFEDNGYDTVYITFKRIDGAIMKDELGNVLYYLNNKEKIGNLATKDYVDSKAGWQKCIYPDGFASRIMPDIYRAGKFFADININDYKKPGVATVFLASDGSDDNVGTQGSPFKTLEKAIAAGAATIMVLPGEYTQTTHFTTSASIAGVNLIGIGEVTFFNDGEGHYITGRNCYIENIHFACPDGDTGSGDAFRVTGVGETVCFVNCVFSGGRLNGLALAGSDAILKNCVAYGNKMDGFNYHDRTVSEVVYTPNVLEIDCVAYDNGNAESGSDSCNGSTAHDGAKIVRLNGEYHSCYGGVIAEIARREEEPTISVNYGVLAHTSTGVNEYNASFWASVNAKMYLYDCLAYGSTYDISAINDALIVSRRLTTGRDVPSVNKAETATVYQY